MRENKGVLLIFIVILAVLILILPVTGSPTTMFRADPRHSGVYDDGGVRPNNVLEWSYITGNPVVSSPTIVDGVVYIGSNDNNLYALNAGNGAVIWIFKTGDWVKSTPAIVSGIVYFGSNDHNVYALNASTGAEIWNFNTGNEVYSSPAILNGILYFSCENGNLYAINAASGAQVWIFNTGIVEYSSPAAANEVVYFGSFNGNVYALNATTGAEIWNFDTGDRIFDGPAAWNNIIYVGSENGNIYALNGTTGTKIWGFITGGGIESSPGVANGIVYIGSGDGDLYAFSAVTGTKVWAFHVGGTDMGSPAIANGVVYVGSTGPDHAIYAIGSYTPTLTPTPVAALSGYPTEGPVPLTVQFTDLSTGYPTSWNWNFGDGTFGTSENPSHTYTVAGTYSVSLTSTTPAGSVSTTRTKYIVVDPLTPSTNNTLQLQLYQGWNFISTPKTLASGYNTGSIFSNVNMTGHSAFIWDTTQNPPVWEPVFANTPIQPLYGIWIFSNSSIVVNLHFDAPNLNTPPSRNLPAGWAAIGFTGFTPTSARNTYLSVQPNWTTSMSFNASTQSYEPTIFNGDTTESTLLYPTKGYWLYMRTPGTLAAIGT